MFNQDQLLFILFKKGKKELQVNLPLHGCFHFGPFIKSDDGNSVKQQFSMLDFGIFQQLLLWQQKANSSKRSF